MNRRDVELGDARVLAYGHWGRPLLVFPSELGKRWDWEDNGMIGALAPLIDDGRVQGLLRRRRGRVDVARGRRAARGARAAPRRVRALDHGHRRAVHPRRHAAARSSSTGSSFGAYHAANFTLKRADLFPLAICMSGVYDVSVVGWGERGDAVYFNNPLDYVQHLQGDHLDWLRSRASLLLVCGQGQWEDTTGALESTKRFAGLLGEKGDPPRARPLGTRRAARLAVVARADRASSAPLCLTHA